MMKRSIFLLTMIALLSACDSKKDIPTAAEMIEKEGSVGAPTQSQANQSLDPLSQTINAGESTKAKIITASLVSVIEVFKAQENRNPASLDELVSMGYIKSLPPMPVGYSMSYDPKEGRLTVGETGTISQQAPAEPANVPTNVPAVAPSPAPANP